MTDIASFLHALLDGLEGEEALFRLGDEDIASADLEKAATQSELFLYPTTVAGDVPFIYCAADGMAENAWRGSRISPTAVLTRGASMILLWALNVPASADDARALLEFFEIDLADPVPTPGASDWKCIHVAPGLFFTLAELTAAYLAAPEEPAEVSEPVYSGDYGDAKVLSPYDEHDPAYAQEIIVSVGANREAKVWKTTPMPIGQLIALLSVHKEGKKDGPSFVFGEVVGGRRLKNSMKALYGVGLDIDTGLPSEKIDSVLASMDVLAVRYTTHSHNSVETKFKKDVVAKYSAKNGLGDEVTDDVMRRYVREEKFWVQEIADQVRIEDIAHDAEGVMIRISHPPIPKNRVVIPFSEPFVVMDEAPTQKEATDKWSKIPHAFARMLGITIDPTGVDPSRLFYLPRHKKNAAFDISLFGGPLFDWRTLQLEDHLAAFVEDSTKHTSKSKTEEGRALGAWSRENATGFQIADVIEAFQPDKVRARPANGMEIECPFDEGHGNAGDPDDRACLVSNAGEFGDLFVVKCRHAGCQDFTMLDMLGKMIADAWFERDVLDDVQWNAEKSAAPAEPEPEADKPTTLQDTVDALTRQSTQEDINACLKEIAALDDGIMRDRLLNTIKKSLSISIGVLRDGLKKYAKKASIDANGDWDNSLRKFIFRYDGEYNTDDALKVCQAAIDRDNTDMPTFSVSFTDAVRMHTDSKTGRLSFEELRPDKFWAEMSERIAYIRKNDHGDGARAQPDRNITDEFFHTAYNKLPQTPEVIYTPVYLIDERLIIEPKWYKDLGILMGESGLVLDEVPVDPSLDQVVEAREWLLDELMGDFPFCDVMKDGEERSDPSRANALAMILTPFMRRMITSTTPVFFISKPKPGTGGTLLGRVPIYIFDGPDADTSAMPYHKDNEDETRKALVAAIRDTRSTLFYDDVKEFNSRPLLQAITAHHIGGRILGQSTNIQRPNNFNWIATGNNPSIEAEMQRRIVDIRLNYKGEKLDSRPFKHKEFETFLKENRAKAIHCILTLINFWIANGKPLFEDRVKTSFEDWSRKVGGVLLCANVEGFLDNPREAATMDESSIRDMIKLWAEKLHTPVTARELYNHFEGMDHEVIEGNTEDQRKGKFRRLVTTLEGQTFTVNGRRLIVKKITDSENTVRFKLDVDTSEMADA